MLEHWIQPLDSSSPQKDYLRDDRIGTNLTTFPSGIRQKPFRAVALVGADQRWVKLIRRHLYTFGFRMPDIAVYDLGDFRRTDPSFVVSPLVELMASEICPVVIGSGMNLIQAAQQSFSQVRKEFRPAIVHESVPEVAIHMDFQSQLIGVQQHLIPVRIPEHIQTLHLSDVRNSMMEAETLIRRTSAMCFDLSAMSAVDLPAQKSFSSSGFCTEEACMLMRYAGLHSGTQMVMITGHDPMSLQFDQSANSAAQLIWYFLEGYQQCIAEDPLSGRNCTTYSVHIESYDTGFTFYKSERTGRWWVRLQHSDLEPVLPCTYRDYQSATGGVISDRLIEYTSKSLKGSKHVL